MAVLIKRYANRKLYNTTTSRYITLKGIAELIEDGEEVRVVDNESGEDITSVTLSQILVDTERVSRSVPGSVLSELIQRGGDVLYSALKRGVGDASGSIEGLQRNVRRLIRSKDGRRSTTEREAEEKSGGPLGDAVGEVEHIVQRTLERVLKLVDLPRRSDIEALNKNLDRVACAIEGLQRLRSEPPAETSTEDSETPY